MLIRNYEANLREPLAKFLAAQYPGTLKSDAGYFRWKFEGNPLGSSLQHYIVALEGSEVVAQLGTLVDRIWSDGAWQECAWLVDLMVSPSHRQQGLVALRLLKEAMGRHPLLLANGMGEKATRLYEGLRWRRLPGATLATRYAVLHPSALARFTGRRLAAPLAVPLDLGLATLQRLFWARRPRGVEHLETLGEEVDRLIERIGPALGATTFRSAALLRWRFEKRPAGRARSLSFRRGGALAGLFTVRFFESPGVARWMDLADVVVDPEDRDAFRELLRAVMAEARRTDCDFVRVCLSHPSLLAALRPPLWIRGSGTGGAVFAYARDPVLLDRLSSYTWHMTGLISDRVDTGQDEMAPDMGASR